MELTLQKSTSVTAAFSITEPGWYAFRAGHHAVEEKNQSAVFLDGVSLANLMLRPGETEKRFLTAHLKEGSHTLRLDVICGAVVESICLEAAKQPLLPPPATGLSDPEASSNAKRLMSYLGSIYGKKMLAGQHTKDLAMEGLHYLRSVTGQSPAVCGFELLGYSPNIDWENSDQDTLTEARENLDTIPKALEWAEKEHGIITYCWHWFSPMSGRGKAFYTEHTDFDCEKAVTPGTPEYEATVSDIDFIAEQLKIFAQKDIPILWRPLHEAEGKWFWWGAKGAEPCKKLWRLMYQRLTRHHGLHNLIWVWNSLDPDWYPGDDCVDIISADIYGARGNHGTFACDFQQAAELSSGKMIALSECGTNPDVELCLASGVPWLWFMTWCGTFTTDENCNGAAYYSKTYASDSCVTLEKLGGE